MPRTNPDRSAIQRIYPASLFIAAFELCQHKHFALTVERGWSITFYGKHFLLWCGVKIWVNSNIWSYTAKAGRPDRCLPRVLPGYLANILILSGSWSLLHPCNASVSITKIACGRAPNKALVGTPSAPHNFALGAKGNIVYNIHFWDKIFKKNYIPQYEILQSTLKARLLPTFENIEKEAEEKTESEWERLGQEYFPEHIDSSDIAEWAQDAGIDHYMNMRSMKQALVNMFAMTLYHVFEQQLMEFHRREVLCITKENDKKYFTQKCLKFHLKESGIDIENFESWKAIDELRLLANAIKHAEGNSSDELQNVNKRLFYPDSTTQSMLSAFSSSKSKVFNPLSGEDIYVQEEDIDKYCKALKSFWGELTKSVESATRA